MNKGLKEGIEKGITTGTLDTKKKMYQAMLMNGLSLEQISQYCSVSIESIKKILN